MDRHERVRSELPAGFEAEENKANLYWRRALECLDRRRIVNLAEHDRRHRELYRAIKKLEERASSVAAPEKHPPQHESPYFENWRQQGTLRG